MSRTLGAAVIAFGAVLSAAAPVRVPVLGQIALPHNYYYRELYLPQLTSGPSAVAWSADGQAIVYSMQGSLWRQRVDGAVAEQLTDGGGDYQPHCSPDGQRVVFVRYDGRSLELMLLDLATREVRALTTGGAVNVEPRWSPDGGRLAFVSTAGTGHFLLHVAAVRNSRLEQTAPLVPDRRSSVSRYYYSAFDHAINPTWTRDGQALLFVSNREIAHGTGDLVRMAIAGGDVPRLVHHEETSWHARPDVSPDGTRIVYSSYVGRQWQQLWLLPVDGGYPFPLTYGDYDNTNPAWSPDGRTIAFISNRSGNTALWLVDAMSGEERPIAARERRYLQPHRDLTLQVIDEAGNPLPARISIADTRQRAYAPDDAWIHADDMLVPERQPIETRYFHSAGRSRISVPLDRLALTVSHGPAYEIARIEEDPRAAGWSGTRTVTLRRLPTAPGSPEWWSGDLHVHMNYGGLYRNTPSRLVEQGRAEDLNVIQNLIVNKEQRFPDIASFRPDLDPASSDRLLLLHGQEFHTSYWGHLGILNLQHLLLPGYAAYPLTAAASPYPHNAAVADMAHAQHGLVGYAHPFDEDVDPRQAGSAHQRAADRRRSREHRLLRGGGFLRPQGEQRRLVSPARVRRGTAGCSGDRRHGRLREPARAGRLESRLRPGRRSVDRGRVSRRNQEGSRGGHQRAAHSTQRGQCRTGGHGGDVGAWPPPLSCDPASQLPGRSSRDRVERPSDCAPGDRCEWPRRRRERRDSA